MKITLGGAVVAGLAAGTLALAGPAVAQEDPALAHGQPEVTIEAGAECGEVELTFTNPTPWLFVFDVRVDGEAAVHGSVAPGVTIAEGPLEGQEFGDRWTLVEVDGSAGVHEVVETFSFTESVEVRLAEGAEQKLFHDWLTFDVEALACQPAPTPTATAGPEPTVAPSSEPTAEPSGTPAPGVGGEQLPKTGVPAAGLAAAGAAALAVGGGALWLARRRKAVSFTA